MQTRSSETRLPQQFDPYSFGVADLEKRFEQQKQKRIEGLKNLIQLYDKLPTEFKPSCRAVAVSMQFPTELIENQNFYMTPSQRQTAQKHLSQGNFGKSRENVKKVVRGQGLRPLHLMLLASFLMAHTIASSQRQNMKGL
ncbi:MAG: hypothetical protein EZS28_021161 [Streblomastix strix]|uniref:Uncharacterized protein n=1 Tax=Streblomastix strix TaxID=222440 RepID=A0A5J4VL52_9EUKA|nr:MAG: hypothetical protein EZS28_021161 [Streblomastix strix]